MEEGPIVIVGAGEAGARAATALRDAGFAGPLTLVGEERHLPYERPPLSKRVMTEAEPPLATTILDEDALAARGIAHLGQGRVARIERAGRRVVLSDGTELPYGKLLLATGARPRRLSVPGGAEDRLLYLRTFDDALMLRDRLTPGRRLVVIGGGFIGLELAASAIGRGCAVSLVEAAPRLLMRGVPAEIAALVQARHERAGVAFRIGAGIAAVEPDGEGAAVVLADGTRLGADGVIAGIGAVPETALAAEAGLAIDNGVAVDGTLRTSDPDIFAAGDCCSFPHPLYGGRRLRLEAWRNAQVQGELAARNMLGGAEVHDAVPWFWSDQYDRELQIAGLPDEGAVMVMRPLEDDARLFFHLAADGRLVAASAMGPNRLIAREMRLAEMLVARRARPDPAALASSAVRLKSLLAA